jgi:hypothetical protein
MRRSQAGGNERDSNAWQKTVIGGTSACLAVLIINFAITIWSATLPKGSEDGEAFGQKTIFQCLYATSRPLSIMIHHIINIFSSVLLEASKYGIRYSSAPARDEVNKAHPTTHWR